MSFERRFHGNWRRLPAAPPVSQKRLTFLFERQLPCYPRLIVGLDKSLKNALHLSRGGA